MDMIERVARAKWEVRRAKARLVSIELEEWGDGSIPRANHAMDEARAAIEAMRKPTEEMCLAGEFTDCSEFSRNHIHVYESMIDAALSQSKEKE